MTKRQIENFYEQNKKNYEVEKNKELLVWLKEARKNGYCSFINTENLQEMINYIAAWYEIKCTECQIGFNEDTEYFDSENKEVLARAMSINQLKYRLSFEQLCLINCNYRSRTRSAEELCVQIKRKDRGIDNDPHHWNRNPSFFIFADANGKVELESNPELRNMIPELRDDIITLDELLILFKENYSEKLNFTQLEECVYDHNCDIELKSQILQMIALKLIYSDHIIPEMGYKKSEMFINEFNEELGLNLSSKKVMK